MPPHVWFGATAQALAEKFGDPESGIAQLARGLLTRANVQRPPFYPDQLAPFCGIRQIRNQRIPGHGLLLRQPDGFAIYVNRRYAWHSSQWNAICAHELGHVLLSQVSSRALNPQNEWVDEDERLANRAARELLLPAKEFRRFAAARDGRTDALQLTPRSGKNDPHVLLKLVAEIFCAPLRMTAHRLVETGVWRDLVLVWALSRGEPLLSLWWPEHHPAASLLRRCVSASDLFGTNSEVHRALEREMVARRLEPVFPQRGVAWLVQSAAFAEYGKRHVLSFVMTADPRNTSEPF